MTTPSGEPITIGLAAHYAFCPRRAWLEAAGEKTDTYQMEVGTQRHRATDDAATAREGQLRAVDVENASWGYSGRCDTVEELEDGSLRVIEYNATPVRRSMEVTEPMRLQLALQVAALESMGHVVAGQEVCFTEHRRRVPVALDAEDFDAARCVVEQARSALAAATAPQPLEDDSRCYRCSHASVCLPDERPLAPVHRRIVVADPDNQVLHLATPGARAALRSGRIEVRKGDEVTTVPLERVQAASVHGSVDLSGALIRELLWREIPVLWTTSTGRPGGVGFVRGVAQRERARSAACRRR